jgi:putative transposase
MSNHYHLLVETPDANISQFMRHLNSVYTQKFNFANERTGYLFQGRFKSILVEKDLYLLELTRYIVLNPVRAEMVRAAKDWPWSSYRATAQLSTPTDWINSDWILGQFSKNYQSAIQIYRRFVSEGRNQPKPWKKLRNQVLLGSDEFVKQSCQQIAKKIKDAEIPQLHYKQRSSSKSIGYYEKLAENRNEAIDMAYASGGFTMKEIADYFKIHYSTVSRAINASCKT